MTGRSSVRHDHFPFAALLVTALVASFSSARAADLSDPKAAARTFVTAMAEHDLETLKISSIGNDEERQRVEAMSDLITAQRKYGDAAAEKFGKEARVPRQNIAADFEEKLKTAVVAIEGDTASLTDPKDEQSPPLKLKKQGSEWKVDLSSMQMRGAAASNAGEQMKKMADAMNTTAQEITNGKYTTFAEAKNALSQRMIPLMNGAALERNRSTAPASQPSKER